MFRPPDISPDPVRIINDASNVVENLRMDKKTGILVDLNSYKLSGVPHLVAGLMNALASGGQSTTLFLPKPHSGLGLFGTASESYAQLNSDLDVRWLPASFFSPKGRGDLLRELECQIEKAPINRLIAIGVQRGGFVATLSAQLHAIPVITWVLFEDAFGSQRNHVAEIEHVIKCADYTAVSDLSIERVLACSYQDLSRCYAVDVEPSRNVIGVADDSSFDFGSLPQDYVATSGVLSRFVNYKELLERIISRLRGTTDSWVHVGSVDPGVMNQLYPKLALLDCGDRLQVTGELSLTRYKNILQGSKGVIIPQGGQNTGLAKKQLSLWGVEFDDPLWSRDAGRLSTNLHKFEKLSLRGLMERILQ